MMLLSCCLTRNHRSGVSLVPAASLRRPLVQSRGKLEFLDKDPSRRQRLSHSLAEMEASKAAVKQIERRLL